MHTLIAVYYLKSPWCEVCRDMVALGSVEGFDPLITVRSPLHWTPILAPLKDSFQHICPSTLHSGDGKKTFQANHKHKIINIPGKS